MEIIILLALVAVLFIPNFLLMRKQKAQRDAIASFQQALSPGKRVVTAGGFHVTVVAVYDTYVDVELAPGVRATVEKSSLLRAADTAIAPATTDAPDHGSGEVEYPQKDGFS